MASNFVRPSFFRVEPQNFFKTSYLDPIKTPLRIVYISFATTIRLTQNNFKSKITSRLLQNYTKTTSKGVQTVMPRPLWNFSKKTSRVQQD